jgi:hypothetical protein
VAKEEPVEGGGVVLLAATKSLCASIFVNQLVPSAATPSIASEMIAVLREATARRAVLALITLLLLMFILLYSESSDFSSPEHAIGAMRGLPLTLGK